MIKDLMAIEILKEEKKDFRKNNNYIKDRINVFNMENLLLVKYIKKRIPFDVFCEYKIGTRIVGRYEVINFLSTVNQPMKYICKMTPKHITYTGKVAVLIYDRDWILETMTSTINKFINLNHSNKSPVE